VGEGQVDLVRVPEAQVKERIEVYGHESNRTAQAAVDSHERVSASGASAGNGQGDHVTMDLAGRNAVVVGASSGIGRAVAAELTALGARVGWCARRAALLEAGIAEAGRSGVPLTADITSDAGCAAMGASAATAFDSLDLVVVASGASGVRLLRDAEADYWERILLANVVGPSLVVRHLLDLLTPGAVVAMLSSESVGHPYPGLVPYAASKAALEELIREWRAEHPELRFSRVTVGTTSGTEFIRDFDPALSAELFNTWLSLGVIPQQSMVASEVGASIARTLGHALLVPGIDVQDIVLRSPGPAMSPSHA
jgi:NAD(P)-dependent dehydrogenase (short-subunit alcohol dehydrogenase family)